MSSPFKSLAVPNLPAVAEDVSVNNVTRDFLSVPQYPNRIRKAVQTVDP
jgi:hypothetical protein